MAGIPAQDFFRRDSSSWPICVVGATGWIGRTLLHELQLRLTQEEFFDRVIAFGSVEKTILSTAYDVAVAIPVFPLSAMPDFCRERKVLILHAAFLTKDRIQDHGIDAFCQINSTITSLVHQSLLAAITSRVLVFSSGAAKAIDCMNSDQSTHMTVDPYGYLKRKEEAVLSSITNARVQVLRVYALTGFFIRTPHRFAVGSFLQAALAGKPVVVESTSPVIRGYVNASDLADSSISWLFSTTEPHGPIAAVTHIVTLASLAEKISKMWSLPAPIIPAAIGSPNSYSASPREFLEFLSRYSVVPKLLSVQLSETASGIARNSSI